MPKRIGKLTRGLGAIVWLYVAMLAVVWLLLRLGGDRWWFATLILFGPRWLCAVPLAALVPAAALVRRRLLWPLTAAAVVAVGPIMGFCLPWARAPRPDMQSEGPLPRQYGAGRLDPQRPSRYCGLAGLLGGRPRGLAGNVARLPAG